MNPHLSVIMVAGGDAAMSGVAVRTLKDTAKMDFQLVFVDNASPKEERLAEAVRLLLSPKDVFVRYDTPRSFARANNDAAKLADGTFLLCINNDIVAEGDWQTPILTEGIKYDLSGPNVRRLVICDDLKSMRCHRPDGKMADASPDEVGAYVEGWCLFTRADYFRGLGGFDEAFWPMYCEDSDLAFRVRASGGTLGKVEVPIKHLGSVNTRQYLKDSFRNAVCEANCHKMYARWVKGAVL